MGNKLSFSQLSSYSLCGERYRLNYIEKRRSKYLRASLPFGSSIDDALNSLLADQDLAKAKQVFDKKWSFQYVNKKLVALKDNPNILYADADFDSDLVPNIEEADLIWMSEFKDYKKGQKWNDIDSEHRSKYNTLNWLSLSAKGHIILESYAKKVLPKFLSVEAIQHKTELVNQIGDSVVQYLDFIATMKDDGRKVLFDNKTTSSLTYYDDDSPGTSQQLISYYYNNRATFNLDGVGFVVMLKAIKKNKTKTCNKCGVVAEEGSRVKTCAEETTPGVKKSRCGGEFNVVMNPECVIQTFIGEVTEAAENLVLSTFDDANVGITQGLWYKNLSVCKNIFGSPCEYYGLCWKGDDSDLFKDGE